MESNTTDIVETAGRIIIESGTDSLSIKALAGEMGINTSQLDSYFEKDEDILMLLLKNLGNDIKQLIIETRTVDKSPEEDLQLLFQNMHELLKLKPYYMSLIFSIELMEKNSELQKVLLSIKISVRTYLFEVINHGKKETVFKTRHTSRLLVTNILGSFRSFMNEQRMINKMVKDLEILKAIND
jgi:AcrR family transcriptional regulator